MTPDEGISILHRPIHVKTELHLCVVSVCESSVLPTALMTESFGAGSLPYAVLSTRELSVGSLKSQPDGVLIPFWPLHIPAGHCIIMLAV
jgi:hypothetical protein